VHSEDSEDATLYEVVVNDEEQYSIWPRFKGDPPLGWKKCGKSGLKQECLDYVKEAWTDMRPLSLRKAMEEMDTKRPELEREAARRRAEAEKKPKDARDDLVGFLSRGEHPVEAGLRPERNVKYFKEAIDRGYVHIKFTETRGGTELGVRLDTSRCDFSKADFKNGRGSVHVEGESSLNYVSVRCIADVTLESLEGKGRLVRSAGESATEGS
jgi:uncharacterized protein YbdZ (MbtH family)